MQKIGNKQEWREYKRLYGPLMFFKQYENPFKHFNFDFKDNVKISTQYEDKDVIYPQGSEIIKKKNAERYNYEYKYNNRGILHGTNIYDNYGTKLINEK